MSPLRKSEESLPAVTTPQMMILGMNCNDEDVQSRPSREPPPAIMAAVSATNKRSSSSSWLSRIISSSSSVAALLPASTTSPRHGNQHDDNNDEPPPEQHGAGITHGYSAMGDDSPQRQSKPPRRHRLSPPEITSDMVYAALGPQQSSPSFASTTGSILLGNNNSSAAAVDDHHGNHDNFFFRSTDDDAAAAAISPRRRRSAFDDDDNNNNHGLIWKTLRRNTRHAELFEYSDAVETLPAPVLQRYRTRYAQLNQEIALPERNDEDYHYHNCGASTHQCRGINNNMVDHDLQLRLHHDDDDDAAAAGPVGPAFNTIAQSNLVYEADGKRLMRLPRDRVRLLMDPDLEPGILSVEGPSRCYHHDNDNIDNNNIDIDNNNSTDQHSIGYVLTVHEDLYRKIVMEMSPRYLQYDAKLDIRYAYLLLTIVMILLLINTVAVHEL
jgi:hypothetical protein